MTQERGHDVLATDLAAHGLRATRQRVAVLAFLRRVHTHPTAAEVHKRLLGRHTNLSLKTVYQVLDSLVSSGLAGIVTDGGEPYRYEANAQPHYHARCRVCGKLFDLPAKLDGQIRGRTPLPEGFDVERVQVTLVGRCPRCRDDF